MSMIVKETGNNFVPAPAGTHPAVCVDVIDLGMVDVTFAGKTEKQHKLRLVWQLAELIPGTDRRYTVGRRYTWSLHKQASLRKDLEAWRGRPFTAEELKGFDVETVLGACCLLNVVQVERNGETYSNVAGIMALPKGMAALKAAGYVRMQDRDQKDGLVSKPRTDANATQPATTKPVDNGDAVNGEAPDWVTTEQPQATLTASEPYRATDEDLGI